LRRSGCICRQHDSSPGSRTDITASRQGFCALPQIADGLLRAIWNLEGTVISGFGGQQYRQLRQPGQKASRVRVRTATMLPALTHLQRVFSWLRKIPHTSRAANKASRLILAGRAIFKSEAVVFNYGLLPYDKEFLVPESSSGFYAASPYLDTGKTIPS
jgi:hypothetical protein